MNEMTLQTLTFILMFLAMVFNAIIVFNAIRDSLKKARIRRQRLFIYAQLAEKFVEWGGLAPRPVGKHDGEDKLPRIKVARYDGSVFEPDIEVLARSENLWQRVRESHAVTARVDPSLPGKDLEANNPLRPLAYVLTCDGYIGPFPRCWVRGIRALDRKGKPMPPMIEVLQDRDPGEDGGKDARDKR